MQKRHRIFIAINLPEEIKRELYKIQERLAEKFTPHQSEGFGLGPVKWTKKDQLHITLEFLGDLTDQELAEVCKIAKEVGERHKPFSVELNKISYAGVRPGSDLGQTPRMIWAGGEKSDELNELKQDLQNYLFEEATPSALDVKSLAGRRTSPDFFPHITLARIKEWEFKKIEPEERPEISEEINLPFTVESIEVMESELKRAGPVYTILESCPFED